MNRKRLPVLAAARTKKIANVGRRPKRWAIMLNADMPKNAPMLNTMELIPIQIKSFQPVILMMDVGQGWVTMILLILIRIKAKIKLNHYRLL